MEDYLRTRKRPRQATRINQTPPKPCDDMYDFSGFLLYSQYLENLTLYFRIRPRSTCLVKLKTVKKSMHYLGTDIIRPCDISSNPRKSAFTEIHSRRTKIQGRWSTEYGWDIENIPNFRAYLFCFDCFFFKLRYQSGLTQGLIGGIQIHQTVVSSAQL